MNKKVLIIVQNFSVPKDIRVWLQACALSASGYRVTVLCARQPGEQARETLNSIDILRVRIPMGAGIIGYALEYIWSVLVITLKVLWLHKRNRFDFIQVCNPPDLFFHLGWLCKISGAKFIFDQHDLCPELSLTKFHKQHRLARLIYRIAILMEGATCSASQAVICTNESYARVNMARHKVSADNVWIVRNGPVLSDFQRTKPRPELRKGRKFMVVYAGVIEEQDGVDLFVEAVRQVVHQFNFRDVLFAVVGDGSALAGIKRLAEKLSVSDFIDFVGWVEMKNLISYMVSADVCVSPEPSNPLNDKSTFAKVTEYIAAGRPVVAFDLPETHATAGNAAIYAQPNDVKELGRKIISILRDTELATKLRENAQGRRALLSWHRSEAVYLYLYQNLLGSKDKAKNIDSASHGWTLLENVKALDYVGGSYTVRADS